MLILTLFACSPWSFPDFDTVYVEEPPWDPEVVAARDGVYVRLPQAGELIRVTGEGWTQVELDGAEPDRLVLAPDGETLLAFTSWQTCEDDDPKIVYPADCKDEDLGREYRLGIVREAEQLVEAEVPPEFNAVEFNEEGTIGVAYLDFSQADDIEVGNVLNLTEAVFLDLTATDPAEMVHPVPIGFAAEKVLFTDTGAVVLSRSEVAVVDLATWNVKVTYPLALDEDLEIQPDDVEIVDHRNPDDSITQYALVTVQGQSDLYVLDLTDGSEHIDVIDLRAVPSDLLVVDVTDPATGDTSDRSVVVFGGLAEVDMIEHETFEPSTYELEEPTTRAIQAAGGALLYNDAGTYRDVYLFDPSTGATWEYVAENPIMELWLSEDGTRAVATLDQEGYGGDFYDQYYGLGIFDLTDEGETISLALGGQPVGVEILENDAGAFALLLLGGVDELLLIDLVTGGDASVELAEPPIGIDAQPDGDFVVSHDVTLGLLSFVDPADPTRITTVSGFATSGLLEEPKLPRRGEEN